MMWKKNPSTPSPATSDRGQQAENLALNYLLSQGLTTVCRNYRCAAGEIDLVMSDNKALIFVEVRYRRSPDFGGAAASIDSRKQQRIIRAAQHYLQQHPDAATRTCRFDVVALDGNLDQPRMQWLKSAFTL